MIDLHYNFIMGNNKHPNSFTDASCRKEKGKSNERPPGRRTEEDRGIDFIQRQQTAVPGRNGVLHPTITCHNCNILGYHAD